MVTVPVDAMEAAVIAPALFTTKFPLATDIVPVVLRLMFEARSAPTIVPSDIWLVVTAPVAIMPLVTELVPGVEVIPVSPEPLPENPVAVTVPMTCRVVEGVVVPMPTVPLPKFP